MNWALNRWLVLVAMFLAGGVVTLGLRLSPMNPTPLASLAEVRPSELFPASWVRFGELAQDQCKARLEIDSRPVDHIRDILEDHELQVQLWIGADGRIVRVQPGPGTAENIGLDLATVLDGIRIGKPPSDMPQPLLVKLALDAHA